MTQKTTKESLEDFITLEKAQTDMCKGYAFGELRGTSTINFSG